MTGPGIPIVRNILTPPILVNTDKFSFFLFFFVSFSSLLSSSPSGIYVWLDSNDSKYYLGFYFPLCAILTMLCYVEKCIFC